MYFTKKKWNGQNREIVCSESQLSLGSHSYTEYLDGKITRHEYTIERPIGEVDGMYGYLLSSYAFSVDNEPKIDEQRTTLEQALTDVDIAQIEAEQMATELDIRVMTLESKEA